MMLLLLLLLLLFDIHEPAEAESRWMDMKWSGTLYAQKTEPLLFGAWFDIGKPIFVKIVQHCENWIPMKKHSAGVVWNACFFLEILLCCVFSCAHHSKTFDMAPSL